MRSWRRRSREQLPALRLPQDVRVAGEPPALSDFRESAETYASEYDEAVRAGDFGRRARALWGLVARGHDSLSWCLAALEGTDLDRIEDAAGVLAWIGAPEDRVPRLVDLVARLPDGAARDAVFSALPAEAAHRLRELDDAAVTGCADEEDLLAGARRPFTETIYFVRSQYATVLEDRAAWSREGGVRGTTHEHRGSLVALLDLLEPVAIPSWKWLLVEAGPDWTAIFSQGSDLSFIAHFATRLRTHVLRASYSPNAIVDGELVDHGNVAFWLSDGARDDLAPLHSLRVIQASSQDSGWSWDLSGEPQPYEEQERYAERLVAKRFDLGMLNRYCRALGIRREDPSYYGPRATLVEDDTRDWPALPEGTPSAEWRRARGMQ